MQDNKIDVEKIIETINKRAEGSTEPIETGLVFEVGGDEQESDKEVTHAPEVSETTEVTEEFSVPDVFTVSEEYNTPASEDYSNHIHMTYVPRFTGVSESYRVRDDSAPTAQRASVPSKNSSVLGTPATSNIDPTAETSEVAVEGAVLVDMTKPSAEDNSDMLNVYKFADEGGDNSAAPRERTVDDEREEIASLLETPTEDEKEEITVEAIPEEPMKKSAEDYELPDPDIEIKKNDGNGEGESCSAPKAQAVKNGILLGEYTVPQQRDAFVQRFLDTLISQRIRFFAALIFSLALLGFEICVALGMFGGQIFGIPVTFMAVGIIDLLLSGCTLALALPEAAFAVRRLALGRIVPSILIISNYAYLVIYCCTVFAIGGVSSYPLFGFIYSIFACSAIASSAFKSKTDFEAFKLISKTEDMQAIRQNLTREVPKENIVLDGLIDEYKSYTARASSTSFISDFVKSSGKAQNQNKHLLIVLVVSLGVSLIAAVLSFFLIGGLLSAVSAFAIVNMLGTPAFMLTSHSVSYSDSAKTLMQLDSAACGEAAYLDFANSKVLVFDDVDIFGPDDVNLKRYVFLGEGDNIDATMRQMCSLFSVAGGPLGSLFANALDNRMTTKAAQNPDIELDGLSGDVGTHRISAGTAEYMIRHGVEISEGVTADTKLDTTKILYAAEDGKLSAKFYIRYSFSEEFTMVLPLLKKEGIVPLIYTRDPNINDELLRLLTAGADSMRVMKITEPVSDSEGKKSRSECATIVTANDKMDVAGVVLHAKKHKRFLDRIRSSELYAAIVGTLLAASIAFSGLLSVPAVVFSVWQIFWCFIVRLASRRTLAPEVQGKNKTAE